MRLKCVSFCFFFLSDIDECKLGTSGCQSVCNNTQGSVVCDCYQGTSLNPADNKTCVVGKGLVAIRAQLHWVLNTFKPGVCPN